MAFIEGIFILNMIILLLINYNTAVISDNLWKAARPYFALLNSQGHAKEFIQIYSQLGRAPSKVRRTVAVSGRTIALTTVSQTVIVQDGVQSQTIPFGVCCRSH